MKIIVADKEHRDRSQLVGLLKLYFLKVSNQRNSVVLEAGTADEAVRLIGDNPDAFAIIVQDEIDQKMKGIDLIRQARRQSAGAKLFLSSSSYLSASVEKYAVDLGCHVIQKPYSMSTLEKLHVT